MFFHLLNNPRIIIWLFRYQFNALWLWFIDNFIVFLLWAFLAECGWFEMFSIMRFTLFFLLHQRRLGYEVIDWILFVLNLWGKDYLLLKNLFFLAYCLTHYLNRILYQPKYAPIIYQDYPNIKISAQCRLNSLGITKYSWLTIWLPIMMDHLFYKFYVPLLFLVDLTAL